MGRISDPEKLGALLLNVAGVVETGLFLGMATKIIVASSGGVEIIDNPG